jgi:PAS domain-containing protein
MQTEARLRAVIDNIVDYAIFSVDLNGRVDTWNRSGERLFARTEVVLDIRTGR